MRIFSFLLCVCFFLVTGCGIDVEQIPLQQPQNTPFDAQPSPIGFNKIRYAIPTGTPIMSTSARGVTGILTCDVPYSMVQRGISSRTFVNDRYKTIFNDTMESVGYDVTGNPGRMFDEEEDMMRTVYSIGARVTDIKIDVCNRRTLWFGFDRGQDGEAMVEVEWTVFDLLHRKNVFKKTVKGYAELNAANFEGIEILMEEAFAASAHNLGSDAAFHDLIFYGAIPQDTPDTVPDPYEAPIVIYDPNENVELEPLPLYESDTKPGMTEVQKAVVMVQAGQSHGSGFFVSKQGHIVTNAHVIGNAARVRVVTHGKKEKIIAEVLRVDRLRDVALLKLEEIPENLEIRLLPVRLEKPEVSEDIFAVGAPRLKRLQDTLTKGIVSAHRYDRKEKQWYIQGDVDVHGGNSGGPLLDANGNIVGVTVSGYFNDSQKSSVGLNFFIPIADALEKLEIGVPNVKKASRRAASKPVELQ